MTEKKLIEKIAEEKAKEEREKLRKALKKHKKFGITKEMVEKKSKKHENIQS